MSTTRRTLLSQGLSAAVAALLSRLPRSRPSPHGPVPRPEFGGPATFGEMAWGCSLLDVAGSVIGFTPGKIQRSGVRPELVFDFPPGTVRGTVLEVLVASPLGHVERRMFSPLTVSWSDYLTVRVPLPLDGSVE